MNKSMICPTCGALTSTNSGKCEYCGSALGISAEETNPNSGHNPRLEYAYSDGKFWAQDKAYTIDEIGDIIRENKGIAFYEENYASPRRTMRFFNSLILILIIAGMGFGLFFTFYEQGGYADVRHFFACSCMGIASSLLFIWIPIRCKNKIKKAWSSL